MMTAFVYGTLRRGEANDILLAAARHGIAAPRLIGTATVRGTLYDFGAYPGLVPDAAGVLVLGDVYQIEPELIAVLDEIEEVYPGQDGLFLRRQIDLEVKVAGQPHTFLCWFYPVTASAVEGRPVIARGDWVAHRQASAGLSE